MTSSKPALLSRLLAGIVGLAGLSATALIAIGPSQADITRIRLNPAEIPRAGVIPPVDEVELRVSPNPMTSATRLTFGMPAPGRALLELYNLKGSLIARREEESVDGGAQSFSWDGHDASGRRVASGTYFARLTVYLTASGHPLTAIRSITVLP